MTIAEVIRERLLNAALLAHLREVRLGVALSGGVDSTSILAALLTIGVRPVIVSYTPSTHESTDFQMARQVASRGRMEFIPAEVDMDPDLLEQEMRLVIGHGFKTKLEVECLVPMVTVGRIASKAGVDILFTGDQADGFFINNNWMARNFDRARGIPGFLRTPVSDDDDPWRIDQLRNIYWDEDRSCSGAVRQIWLQEFGLEAEIPYRDEVIRQAFRGSLWTEVNQPRFKEPIRQAFPEWIDTVLPTRPAPVNLHRGDSYFAERFGKAMMNRLPGPWRTTTGLYSAIARREI